MTFATRADGIKLWYEIKGKGDPLVLIGGFALLHNQFEFCEEMLLKAGFQLINWNQEGAGNSDWSMTRPYTVEGWVDDLKCVLDHSGHKKVYLWSTSTGTAIGIRFAAKYPQLMAALITYPWFKSDLGWKRIFDAAFAVADVFGIETLAKVFATVVLPESIRYTPDHIKYEKWSQPTYKRNVNMTTLRNVLDALSNVDLTADVKRLKCPTLLLMGNDSALNKDEKMKSSSYDYLINEFRALKPETEVATVLGAGSTYCMITRPKDTSQLLIDWVRKLKKKKARS
jgi:pimeloyl-ACP methyl ester carboxylesterase